VLEHSPIVLNPTIARFACALLLASACGGSRGPNAATPLTAAQAMLFEDGIDVLTDPKALQDNWRTDWEAETQARIKETDRAVLGHITTLRTQEDPGKAVSYHIVVAVDKTLIGEPIGNEVVLVSREGTAGYGGVAGQGDRLLRLDVIAFIKYAREDTGVVPHFHLVIPSPSVFALIDEHEKHTPGHEVKIIEHTQK
jgi:hypothetical protein